MLLWSVYRTNPLKCYKNFGDDLNEDYPKSANEKLESMAVSIVRDRIANMSIDEILKNRNKLRSGIREEVQKLLTGWGMWLETIEIQDVRIASDTLFKNLQTDFREKMRHSAVTISSEIQNELNTDAMNRKTIIDTLKYESATEL